MKVIPGFNFLYLIKTMLLSEVYYESIYYEIITNI